MKTDLTKEAEKEFYFHLNSLLNYEADGLENWKRTKRFLKDLEQSADLDYIFETSQDSYSLSSLIINLTDWIYRGLNEMIINPDENTHEEIYSQWGYIDDCNRKFRTTFRELSGSVDAFLEDYLYDKSSYELALSNLSRYVDKDSPYYDILESRLGYLYV